MNSSFTILIKILFVSLLIVVLFCTASNSDDNQLIDLENNGNEYLLNSSSAQNTISTTDAIDIKSILLVSTGILIFLLSFPDGRIIIGIFGVSYLLTNLCLRIMNF